MPVDSIPSTGNELVRFGLYTLVFLIAVSMAHAGVTRRERMANLDELVRAIVLVTFVGFFGGVALLLRLLDLEGVWRELAATFLGGAVAAMAADYRRLVLERVKAP